MSGWKEVEQNGRICHVMHKKSGLSVSSSPPVKAGQTETVPHKEEGDSQKDH